MCARVVFAIALLSLAAAAQQPRSSVAQPSIEFPAHLTHKIEAGKTPVGTVVEAKLTMATLVRGKVIPEGAVLSGIVQESTAKRATEPSRLRIHIISARWDTGEAQLNAYLTSMYHPFFQRPLAPQDRPPLGLQSSDAYNNDENVERKARHDELDRAERQSHQRRDNNSPPVGVSGQRIPLSNVTLEHAADGGVSVTASRRNVKLDTTTIYVFEGTAP